VQVITTDDALEATPKVPEARVVSTPPDRGRALRGLFLGCPSPSACEYIVLFCSKVTGCITLILKTARYRLVKQSGTVLCQCTGQSMEDMAARGQMTQRSALHFKHLYFDLHGGCPLSCSQKRKEVSLLVYSRSFVKSLPANYDWHL